MTAGTLVRAVGLALSVLPSMVRVPAGSYRPLHGASDGHRVPVASFLVDQHPVTRGEFLRFVKTHVEWRRGQAKAPQVDSSYLAEWRSPLDAGDATDRRRPATSVSWHAAKAYCAATGKRLVTTAEWEYVAAASATLRDATVDPAFTRAVLAMYVARTRAAPEPTDRDSPNSYGVYGLHSSVWEWTEDFKGEGMASCAGAAMGATDPANYPALMRDALRNALSEHSSTRQLGFRCAS